MSLYRKYRPQTFEDVVGQEHVARTLRNALTATPSRVAHAYLFTGPRGIGKTTNARLLAKCLNCAQGPTPTPCNVCDFCTRVTNNQPVMDLLEIDAASNTGVDNIRETIIDKVNMAPAEGRYRVYIIDEVHMLSPSSFNALLKTLEEPPPHAVFILATTDSHKIPQTVLSRCQRFDFRRVTPPEIAKRLLYVAGCENLKLHEDAARLIARHADGALRDALTLLEQVSAYTSEEITASDVRLVLGGVPQELIDGLIEGVANHDPHAVLGLIERAIDEGASFGQLSRDLTAYARDLLLLSVGFGGDDSLTAQEKQTRQHHTQLLGRYRIENLIASLRETEKEMRQGGGSDHRLLLELALVRACDNAPTAPAVAVPALRSVPAPRAVAAPPRIEKPVAIEEEVAAPTPTTAAEVEPVVVAVVTETEVVPEVEVPQVASPDAELVDSEAPVSEALPATPKKGRRITNLEELVELWPAVIMRIRKRIGVTAVAYLHDARPVGLTETEITLEFSKEFHHAKATEASKRLPFEEKINETLDKPRQLKFLLVKPKAAEPIVEEPPAEDDEEDDFNTDIIEYTQNMFAADIVGRSG